MLSELSVGGPTRVSDLAQQQRVTQPTMTSLVHRLEGETWVERQPDPSDGRATLVVLTETGAVALREYRAAAAAQIVPLLAQLDDEDQAILARASILMQQLSDFNTAK